MKQEYSGLPEAVQIYEAEIARVETLLGKLGMVENGNVIYSDDAEYIVLGDIYASPGNISITADSLNGIGYLTANGEAEVSVINNSHKFLLVNQVEIPTEQGGNIYLNNETIDGYAYGLLKIDASGPGTSSVLIANTYDPNRLGNDYRGTDITLSGDIKNLNGSVSISAPYGNIDSNASITAGDLSIVAGGSFVQAYTDTMFNVANSPEAIWGDAASAYESGDSEHNPYASDEEKYAALNNMEDTAIIAEGKISISARYINVNGLIQSGIGRYDALVAGQKVVSESGDEMSLSSAKSDYLSQLANGNYSASSEYKIVNNGKVTGYYDARDNVIYLNEISFSPGEVELYGQIINTNFVEYLADYYESQGLNLADYVDLEKIPEAKIVALSGYPTYTLNNSTDIPVVIQNVNIGGEKEGVIKITDLGTPLGGDRYLVTEYRYNGQGVETYTNEWSSGMSADVLVNTTAGRESSFSPVENTVYHWVTGQKQILETTEEYADENWWFIDISNSEAISSNTINLDEVPLLEGQFITIGDSSQSIYAYDRSEQILSEETVTSDTSWTTETGWGPFGTRTYHREIVYETGTKTYNDHQVRADYPIAIEFSGQDTSDISIFSEGDVHLAGVINNPDGELSITSNLGKILSQSSDSALIAESIDLDGKIRVGNASQSINFQLSSEDGVLNASSLMGEIYLNAYNGDFRFDQIDAHKEASLRSSGGIYAHSDDSLINGDSIALEADSGGIGTASLAVRLDTSDQGDNGVTATAYGDIVLEEVSGGLGVNRIESFTGDVTLTVPGDVYDVSIGRLRDIASDAELVQVWEDTYLRAEDGASVRAQAGVVALENYKTHEYQKYWDYRNRQTDSSNYDSDFVISFTDTEREALALQGLTSTQIDAIEVSQTEQYHSLHSEFGSLGDVYKPDWTYQVNSTEAEAMTDGAVWTEDQLRNSIAASLMPGASDVHINIDDSNIKAKNISIVAGGSVGRDHGVENITISGNTGLSDYEMDLLDLAEPGDIELSEDQSTLIVHRREDLDLNASGRIDIQASDHIYLGSEADLNVGQISTSADSTIRLLASSGIYDTSGDDNANIVGKELIIESDAGSIGTAANPLTLDLDSQLGSLHARSNNNIYLRALFGDLFIDQIYTPGNVSLEVDGSLYDAQDDDITDIKAKNIKLIVSDSIGEADNHLKITTLSGSDGSHGALTLIGEAREETVSYQRFKERPTGFLGWLSSFGRGDDMSLTETVTETRTWNDPLDSAFISNTESSPLYLNSMDIENVLTIDSLGDILSNGVGKTLTADYVNLTSSGDIGTAGNHIKINPGIQSNPSAQNVYVDSTNSNAYEGDPSNDFEFDDWFTFFGDLVVDFPDGTSWVIDGLYVQDLNLSLAENGELLVDDMSTDMLLYRSKDYIHDLGFEDTLDRFNNDSTSSLKWNLVQFDSDTEQNLNLVKE